MDDEMLEEAKEAYARYKEEMSLTPAKELDIDLDDANGFTVHYNGEINFGALTSDAIFFRFNATVEVLETIYKYMNDDTFGGFALCVSSENKNANIVGHFSLEVKDFDAFVKLGIKAPLTRDDFYNMYILVRFDTAGIPVTQNGQLCFTIKNDDYIWYSNSIKYSSLEVMRKATQGGPV